MTVRTQFPPSQWDAAIDAAEIEFKRLRRLRAIERKKAVWTPEARAAQSARKLGRKLGKKRAIA